jgi:hypothetical protein
MFPDDDQAEVEHRHSFVASTSGIFKSKRPTSSPEQEQEAFERGVADDVRAGLER